MQIILLSDIANLGQKDDVINVKPGYGRNYLIPQGYAILATESAKKIVAENTKQRAHKEARLKAEAEELALAGKGFNKAIEAKYFEDSTEILQKVDLVEENKVSTEEIVSFLEEGNLNN